MKYLYRVFYTFGGMNEMELTEDEAFDLENERNISSVIKL